MYFVLGYEQKFPNAQGTKNIYLNTSRLAVIAATQPTGQAYTYDKSGVRSVYRNLTRLPAIAAI